MFTSDVRLKQFVNITYILGDTYYMELEISTIVFFIIAFLTVIFLLVKNIREKSKMAESIQKLIRDLVKERDNSTLIKNEYAIKESKILKYQEQLEKDRSEYKQKLWNSCRNFLLEKEKSMHWLAGMLVDYELNYIDAEIEELNNSFSIKKYERAIKLTDLKKALKEQKEQNKLLIYTLEYYRSLYPSLIETIELVEEKQPENPLEDNGYLSTKEYEQLSDLEKNKIAFERYKTKNKTKWQIGRDFEMYVGYKYKKEKYDVIQYGIEKKLEDLGIDIIAENANEILLIQCKYWSSEKLIHEKHICQLFGTYIKYTLEHSLKKKVIPLFICHNKLSNTAKQFAEKLGVMFIENVELGEYPMIKCNFQSGIYHLPFDEQYDHLQNDDVEYVFTVEEAEEKNFRRAWKWRKN